MNILRINLFGLLRKFNLLSLAGLLSTAIFLSPQSFADNISTPSQTTSKAQCSSLKEAPNYERLNFNQNNVQTSNQEIKQAHSSKATDSDKAITIHANQVDYQPGNKLELVGDVEIIQGPYRVTSNEAKINSLSSHHE